MYVIGGEMRSNRNLFFGIFAWPLPVYFDISLCMKFDVNNLKWSYLPHMNKSRKNFGSFKTKDGKWLYVFGANNTRDDYFERLNLESENEWERMDVRINEKINNVYGVMMWPL